LDKSFFGDFGISITVLVAPQQNSRRIPNRRAFLHAMFVSSTL